MEELNKTTNQALSPKSSRGKAWWWLAIITVLIVAGYFAYKYYNNNFREKASDDQQNPKEITEKTSWQTGELVIPGNFADADVVKLDDGSYRIYFATEPEIENFRGQIYSSTSKDGINWAQEEGSRIENAAFPDVIKLPDNSWRMYFQKAGEIKSAISSDGLKFTEESGVRISDEESGYTLDNVAAGSTIIMDDDSYLMVYRGTINTPYETTEKIPNQTTQIYFYATSEDGLNFSKKGIAIDSRNETLFGLADGGDLVKWDDGELRVYFWSYNGVYHVVFSDGVFSTLPIFDYSNNTDSKNKFSPNPPSDPSLIKISESWFMYYGEHTKGIYYVKLQ